MKVRIKWHYLVTSIFQFIVGLAFGFNQAEWHIPALLLYVSGTMMVMAFTELDYE